MYRDQEIDQLKDQLSDEFYNQSEYVSTRTILGYLSPSF
jgi:hypothetical protein